MAEIIKLREVQVYNDGKDEEESVAIWSKDCDVEAGLGQYENEAMEDFIVNINIRIGRLLAFRDSLDDRLTKVYVNQNGDPI